jgi:hypothetical protein
LLLVCNHIHTTTANCLHNAMPTSWLEYMHSPACVCASQAHEVAFCKWKLDAWVLVVFVHPSQLPKTPQQRKLSVRTRTMQGTDISLKHRRTLHAKTQMTSSDWSRIYNTFPR